MLNSTLTSSIATLDIEYNSALDTQIEGQLPPWSPPAAWNPDDADPDQRTLVQALVDAGMYPKADAAATCRAFYREVLKYANHWVRVGCTTCHLKTCRNCGRGKMRAHQIHGRKPQAYEIMTEREAMTMRLVIRYDTARADEYSYMQRVDGDKRHIKKLWRRLRAKCEDAGLSYSIEPDTARQNTIFRIYYVGEFVRHSWVRSQWQQIVGHQAEATTREWDEGKGKEAFIWVLDSLTGVLMLAPGKRVAWEKAFGSFRLTSSMGALRGIEDEASEIEGGTVEAPHGYCPCGCGGIVERSIDHSPLTLQQLGQRYQTIEFGPLCTYLAGSRSKVARTLPEYTPRGQSPPI